MSYFNICITGASGYIGSKLLQKLISCGHNVTVLTRSKDLVFPIGVKVVIGDLTKPDNCIDYFLNDCDVIYHCAAQIYNHNIMHDLHVVGTQNLIKYIAKNPNSKKIHWVQLSSIGVYGSNTEGFVGEDADTNPTNIYEKTKLISDEIVLEAANRGLITANILRPANVYSPDMINQSIFSLISMIDRGLFFYIDKHAVTNYIHVDNVISALLLLSSIKNNPESRIYNLSDCQNIKDTVDIICANLNRSNSFIVLPTFLASFISYFFGFIPGFPLTRSRFSALTRRVRYDTTRIHQEIGYCHVVGMEVGMADMVKRYVKSQK